MLSNVGLPVSRMLCGLARSDAHRLLGVLPGASMAEVKEAYRKKAMEHHPDRHMAMDTANRGHAERAFKDISEAFEAVMLSSRRRSALSQEDAERLFWEVFGPNGAEVGLAWRLPGRSNMPPSKP